MYSLLSEIMSDKRVRTWANLPHHRLVVGIIDRGQRGGWPHDQAESEAIYEIGSITKTLTGLLLAVGEQRGFWSRDERVSDLMPEWDEYPFARQTSLLQLVTHTSGLPRISDNMRNAIADKMNPYANYTEIHLSEAVRAEKPKGMHEHRYSNYGFGLLGYLLAQRLGTSLQDAFAEYLFHPLRMTNSGIGSRVPNPSSVVPVFNAKGKPVPPWDFQDATAGAGAVRSTLSDMLRYIEAHLGVEQVSLTSALEECRKLHYAIDPNRGVGIGYGWMLYKEPDGSTTWWHNGGTYGSSSFAAFNREKQRGFVILSNYGADAMSFIPLIGSRRMSVDRLARMLSDRYLA